jgi:hypothetical protein
MQILVNVFACVLCVFVCTSSSMTLSRLVCVCVCERERESTSSSITLRRFVRILCTQIVPLNGSAVNT